MSRKKIVAGNWKMNKDYLAGMELISEVVYMIKDELHKEVTTVFATPYIHLSSVSKLIQAETNFQWQHKIVTKRNLVLILEKFLQK
jgi:triosephosphate isomerase